MIRMKVDPRIETSGAAMLALVSNLHADQMQHLLIKHELIDITADGWYPAQKWFDIFDELYGNGGGSADLVAIGMAVVETAKTPPGFEKADLPTMLALWNEHYHLNHRSPIDIGSVTTERVDGKHIKVILTTLYPDDLCYGMTYGYARLALPKGTFFKVWYDKDEPRLDDGGRRTIIHVQWE
jgi:hypothetical protein